MVSEKNVEMKELENLATSLKNDQRKIHLKDM